MSDKIKQFAKTNDLFEKYGSLLTEAQRQVMREYYEYDLSLSEIAENLSVSRTAVSDALKKSVAKLENFEGRLHLLKKDQDILDLIAKIEKAPKAEQKKYLEELKRRLAE